MRTLKLLVATQEPTVIPRPLLDLFSFTVCHRLTSPTWYEYLRPHMLLGDASGPSLFQRGSSDSHLYQTVSQLRIGQALIVSPSALVLSDPDGGSYSEDDGLTHLGNGHFLIQIRPALSPDSLPSHKQGLFHTDSNELGMQYHSNIISPPRANGIGRVLPNSAPPFTHPPMFGAASANSSQFFGHSPTSKFFNGGSTRHPSQSPETQLHSFSSASSTNSVCFGCISLLGF